MIVEATIVLHLAVAGPPPKELLALESARQRWRRARITWEIVSSRKPERPGMVPTWYFYDRPRYFTATIAGNDFVVRDKGDPEGVVHRGPDGEPAPEIGYSGKQYLVNRDGVWTHREGALSATLRKGSNLDVVDPRLFGVGPALPQGDDLFFLTRAPGFEREYEVRKEGDLVVVTASQRNSNYAVRWWIDPRRGWNAVRVQALRDGTVVSESRTQLRRWGEIWFPEKVEYFEGGGQPIRSDARPAFELSVLSVEFDEPSLPQRLGPADIGVDVGTIVHIFEHDDPFRARETRIWDGHKLIPRSEYAAKLRSGELKPGQRHQRAVAMSLARGHLVDTFAERWERYVRRFIQRYRLDEQQQQKAFAILKDCVQQGRRYLATKRDVISRLRQEREALLADRNRRGQKNVDEHIRQITNAMLEIQAPLTRIFYSQLVPRLERLPTRAQRRTAKREGEWPAPASGANQGRPSPTAGASGGPP